MARQARSAQAEAGTVMDLIFKRTATERAEQARRREPLVNPKAAPARLRRNVAGVVRNHTDAANLAHALGGPDVKPFRPILVDTGDSRQRRLIVGDGDATAAELQDLALKATEEPRRMDFDALREKRGDIRREQVDSAIREALHRRVAQHKANPITDPPRIPGGKQEKRIW